MHLYSWVASGAAQVTTRPLKRPWPTYFKLTFAVLFIFVGFSSGVGKRDASACFIYCCHVTKPQAHWWKVKVKKWPNTESWVRAHAVICTTNRDGYWSNPLLLPPGWVSRRLKALNLQGSDAMENKTQGPVFAPSSLPPGDWEANGIKLWKLPLQK